MTCYIDGSQFNISDDDLIRTVLNAIDPIIVQVSVIFKIRVAGLYECNFTTDRVTITPLTNSTPGRNITSKNKIKHYLISLSLNSNWITSKPDIQ